MKTGEVVEYLDSMFHPEYQEDYDNSGFLLGDAEADYRGALVAVDLTAAVVEEAIAEGLGLIVTHHPFIFAGVKRLTSATEEGRLTMRLIKNDIAVYAAHTNLDNLPWGVNGALAAVLGVERCRVLKPQADKSEVGAGLIGELREAMECDTYLGRVKEALGLPIVRTSAHEAGRLVRRVALCGGSGAFLTDDALEAEADLYLTADLKYHDFQRTDGRMVLADIGHYESEQFAKDVILRLLSEKFSNFACRKTGVQGSIVEYI